MCLNNEKEIVYSKRVLVFYDLLGFKDLIERSLENPYLVNKILKEFFSISGQEAFAYNYEQINFSDTIIQIFDPEKCLPTYEDNYSQFINRVLEAVNRAHIYLLTEYKIAIRGSIVYGDIYYKKEDNIIFGPALNRAATLEKQTIYPRVILDESIVSLLEVKETIETTFLNYTFDQEGRYYANPFQYIAKTKHEQKKGDIQKIKQNLLEMIKEVENSEVEEKEKKKIIDKIQWLLVQLVEREMLDLDNAKNHLIGKLKS